MSTLRTLAFEIRKRLPEPVRTALRLARHVFGAAPASPALPASLFENCRVFANRTALIASLPRGGLVAEVGTLRGEFAVTILSQAAPRELHLIDLAFHDLEPSLLADSRVRRHAGDSAVTLSSFPDEYFDWIYIDADHSYAGVVRDIEVAAAKVRRGGFLVFNDFAHIDAHLGRYGVHRAVCDHALRGGWQFHAWAFSPHALYDVALQRPQ